MVKNTGIPGNQLSDLDMGSVLKDSHNKPLHALDVNVVNSLVPERYSIVSYELKDMGDGTKETEFVNFYGDGTKESAGICLRSTFLGTYEITTLAMTSQTPAGLDGKYIIIYDDVGSVGVWFDLDNGSTPPTTGAARDVEIDISTGDSADNLAVKLANGLDSDSKFSGSSITSLAVIQASTVGNKTDATQGNTSISVSITNGIDTLNDKYLYLYAANDATEYYVWFNFNSTGTDPAISGKTGIEVAFTGSDTLTTLSETMASNINSLDGFSSSYTDGEIIITNVRYGPTTDLTDVNTDSIINVIVEGGTGELVAKIQVFFDSDNIITSIERIQ